MRKLSVFAVVAVALSAAEAQAVEFKNVRATYGPFGAIRSDNKMLPGDVYTLTFDIVGLAVDPKTAVAKYIITLEVFDPKGKQIMPDKDKTSEQAVLANFGGGTVPESARVMLGADKPPGKYKVVITVAEPGSKNTKQLVHEVELLPEALGFLHISCPAVGITGQGFPGIAPNSEYVLQFAIVGATRDAKKLPKLTVVGRILDEAGKPTMTEPLISYKIPEDLPESARADFAKKELIPLVVPMWLNRPGRFTVQIDAHDEISKKKASFSYTLTVINPVAK